MAAHARYGSRGREAAGVSADFGNARQYGHYQQISIFAAGAILRRLIDALRRSIPTIDGYRLFPSPNILLKTGDATLHGSGLSKSKVASLRALATAVIDGLIVDEELAKLPTL